MGAKTQCNGKKTQCNGIKGPTHMGAEKSFPWEQKNHSRGNRRIIPMGAEKSFPWEQRIHIEGVKDLFLRDESLPSLVVIENANLCDLASRFVKIFRIEIWVNIGCICYTLLILHRLTGLKWGIRRG